MLKGKKIALLTLQHFANAPRAQKEAAALAAAGAEVTVFGSWWSREKAEEDRALAAAAGVIYQPLLTQFRGEKHALLPRLRTRLAKEVLRRTGVVLPETFGSTARPMLTAVRSLKPDLTMVHCEPGLWAGCRLLKEGFRIGIDFEDWFSEDLLPEARVHRPVAALAAAERTLLREGRVRFATTEAMATALADWAGTPTPPLAIPNCFPWAQAPRPSEAGHGDPRSPTAVSFYWFSQTIGPGRGLETLARALTTVRGDWQLHLRGELRGHRDWFEALFPPAIRERVIVQPTVSNRELAIHSASHDVGLALEVPYCQSRDLTATNKIFEYLRCGLAVIATATAGQAEVMKACPAAGWVIPPDDAPALAKVLQDCLDQPAAVTAARQAARQAATGTWAWERFAPQLVGAVATALAEPISRSR